MQRMRKLYEIDRSIEELLSAVTDPDTGEIVDLDALDDLLMEREQKIENVILFYKDVQAELAAVTHEYMTLQGRAERLGSTADGLKLYISKALNGEKFKTAKCEVSYRKSEAVDVDDGFIEWANNPDNLALHFVRRKITDTPDRAAIKKYLKEGGSLEHCRLVEKQNISIK